MRLRFRVSLRIQVIGITRGWHGQREVSLSGVVLCVCVRGQAGRTESCGVRLGGVVCMSLVQTSLHQVLEGFVRTCKRGTCVRANESSYAGTLSRYVKR